MDAYMYVKHIYIFIYVYTCVHKYSYTQTHVCIFAHTFTSTQTHTHILHMNLSCHERMIYASNTQGMDVLGLEIDLKQIMCQKDRGM